MEYFGSISRLMAGLTLLSVFQIWSGPGGTTVQATSKMNSMHGQQVLLFSICTSWGYRNAVNQYANMIRQRYPENELKVEVMNHPVPQTKQTLASIFSMLKFAFIICALMNFDPAPMLGLAQTPAFLLWAWENKGYACMMAFFVGNAIENTLVSTGAFEIYLADEKLWSKLETGRIPSQGELYHLLEQVTRLQSGQFTDNSF